MRKILYTLLLVLLPITAFAEISLSDLINQAGAQRMLTQRIIKAYTQVLIDIDPVEAAAQLEEAVDLFDKQLNRLDQHAPSEQIAKALQKTQRLWVDFRAIARGSVSRQGLDVLRTLDEPLLKATNDTVLRLQDYSGTAPAKLVNTAGRQRMLSQRITKFYMLASAGLHDTKLNQNMLSARYEFEGALSHLENAPENTHEIQQGLAEVSRQWIIFRTSFQLSEESYIPFLIAKSAEKILVQMDQVTELYAQLGQ